MSEWLAGLTPFLLAAADPSQQACMPLKEAKALLAQEYGELPEGGGKMMDGERAALFLFRNPRTGSWSILKNTSRSTPDGDMEVCLLAVNGVEKTK